MSYGLYIGKNHTSDGIAYLAGYGDEPSRSLAGDYSAPLA